jgi:hypothetical protein
VLRQIEALVGVMPQSDHDRPPAIRLAQLEYLRGLANYMKALESQITLLGGNVPSEAVEAGCNFLETVEAGVQKSRQPGRKENSQVAAVVLRRVSNPPYSA